MKPSTDPGHDQAALTRWSERVPSLAGLPGLVAKHPSSFRFAGGEHFLDIACDEPVRGRANRSHLRMTAGGDGELRVVFYRAALSEGGGTYGYGGLAARTERLRTDQVRAWLDYLASGFAAESAPRGLQTSFQYPVPAAEPVP